MIVTECPECGASLSPPELEGCAVATVCEDGHRFTVLSVVPDSEPALLDVA